MFKLRWGYAISGIITGCLLLVSFITSLPDGKLHITYCDVGQGDGAYIKFPDGRDMVVDGGPSDKILECLGDTMPFWDRTIDLVVLTHPQKDHMQGLISILDRYAVGVFVRSRVEAETEGYKLLLAKLSDHNVPVKFVTQGETISIGTTTLSVIWPSQIQLAKAQSNVLGASIGDLNDYSVVFSLQYGSFDALFTGDADIRVEQEYIGRKLSDGVVEVLKVPHHGSKTGMNSAFVEWVRPKIAIISSGKNSYGHPSAEAITLLQQVGAQILRTDQEGDIQVVSDGKSWGVQED